MIVVEVKLVPDPINQPKPYWISIEGSSSESPLLEALCLLTKCLHREQFHFIKTLGHPLVRHRTVLDIRLTKNVKIQMFWKTFQSVFNILL